MHINGFMGQLRGPFTANQELCDLIVEQAAYPVSCVSHIGVQSDIGSIIYINEEPYEIGKTGIYEIGNTEIVSIYFDSNKDNNTVIDYTIVIDEEN